MRKLPIVAMAGLGVIALAIAPGSSMFIWNHTASIPVGLYMRTGEPIEVGATVSFPAPPVAREYAILRGGTGEPTRFIKPLAAGPNDEVCMMSNDKGEWLSVNSRLVLSVHPTDRYGNPLPHWLKNGCQKLGPDEWLPIGTHPDSFDGRYFGPIKTYEMKGTYEPVMVFP